MSDPDFGGESISVRIELEPIDTLFFRDSRPFDAASRAATGLPAPQTLAGAVLTSAIESHGIEPAQVGDLVREGTTFAEALARFGAAVEGIAKVVVNGPWFCRNGEVLTPVPANLKREKKSGRIIRLDPLDLAPPGWIPAAEGMHPLWRRGRSNVETIKGYMTTGGLRRFLAGNSPNKSEIIPESEIFGFDNRTGIGVDSDRNTAGDGQIYGIRMLAVQKDVRIVGDVVGPRNSLAPLMEGVQLIKFGGEGKQARLRTWPGCIKWPAVAPVDDVGRLLLMLTPACFNGWRPAALKPVSASIPGYRAVSGWDLARRGPKPNRFMVPSGSVYFLAPRDRPPENGLVASEEIALGWGKFVEGNWYHA